MSKKKILLGSIVILVAVIVVITATMNKNGGDGVSVETAEVAPQKIVQTVTATGRIQPKTQVKISADVAAKIMRIYVKEGDWVEKGDLLVQLDKERYNAEVESQEANVRSAEANAKLARENMMKAEKDYDRTRELFDKKLESQATLDQVNAAYQVEKARYQSNLEQVEQVKGALKQAQDALSKTTIYAPISGTISKLNKEEGEIALGSQFQEDVIMVVSNLTGMEALVDVDENDIVSVSLNDSAKIEVDALPDKIYSGVVSEIANSAKVTGSGTTDQKTEFEVKIAVENAGSELRPGMTASSDIVTDTRNEAIAVPIQSVAVRTPEQLKRITPKSQGDVAIANDTMQQNFEPDKDGFVTVVFVVENGYATARQVKTGIQSDTHIEIVEGLKSGEEIVVGNYRAISQDLQNGSPVIIKKAMAAN